VSTNLVKIWISSVDGRQELRLDWSNDRHHAMPITPPASPREVAMALYDLAYMVKQDPVFLQTKSA
jgi:hypothetical protein